MAISTYKRYLKIYNNKRCKHFGEVLINTDNTSSLLSPVCICVNHPLDLENAFDMLLRKNICEILAKRGTTRNLLKTKSANTDVFTKYRGVR